MAIKPVIRFPEKFFVEPRGVESLLVRSNENDCAAIGIECKGRSPDLSGSMRIESQFLHVGMPGICKRCHVGAARLRPQALNGFRARKEFGLNLDGEGLKLLLEIVMEFDLPVTRFNQNRLRMISPGTDNFETTVLVRQ
ncbi:hypothetical protein FHS28_000386 [Roseateles terrae]|uniref:Uncharacterized protein n=1 Tax=Roseateles terrae TaxID=431060 RepID=A0ABR6GMT1_9BURK|nr:hypothetical protein [Roseateles terrae]